VHILTKVLVVFAAVLSIFLTALTISYSANADRITQSISGEIANRTAAQASLAAQSADFGSEKVRLQQEKQELQNKIAQANATTSQLQSENSRLVSEKAKAENDRDANTGKVAEHIELARTQQALISSYREEVTQLRKNELDYRSQALALEARLSDLESQREVLEGSVRALQEQLTEAKLAIEGGARPGSTGRAGEPFAFIGPLIQSKVESVSKDPSSNTLLAKINVGSNDQIRENMKMFIVRDGTFIGNLVIVKTDLRWSVGRIDTLNIKDAAGKPVQVREGDVVWSKLQ
jgi:hypothetical protein